MGILFNVNLHCWIVLGELNEGMVPPRKSFRFKSILPESQSSVSNQMHLPHSSTTWSKTSKSTPVDWQNYQHLKTHTQLEQQDLLFYLLSIPLQQFCQVDLVTPPTSSLSFTKVFLSPVKVFLPPASSNDAWYWRSTAEVKNTATGLSEVDDHIAEENSVKELGPVCSHMLQHFILLSLSIVIRHSGILAWSNN